MNIKYWNGFTKRKNSTKQPNNSDATTINVRLKDNTSVLNPTFELTTPNLLMNYLQWEGRYYFVNNTTLRNNNVYEVSCSNDPLASHKSAIGNYTAFVERSASAFDEYINDPYVSARQPFNVATRATSAISGWSSTGCYVVRVAGKNSMSNTGVATYAVTNAQLTHLIEYAFGDILDGITNEIVKGLFNPFQYILSVKWFPLDISVVGTGNSQTVYLGKYATDVTAPLVGSSGHVFTQQLTSPSAYYNDFRDLSPAFTQAKILVPTVGLVDIDPTHLMQGINAEMCIDYMTGESTVLLSNYDSGNQFHTFMSLKGNASCDIQISQTAVNSLAVAGNIASTGANIAVGNYVAAAAESVEAISAITQPTLNILSQQGTMSFLKWISSYYIYTFRHGSKDLMTNTAGRPLCENRTISSLSGYIKCSNASVPIAGYESEKEAINNYLNTGFYYE